MIVGLTGGVASGKSLVAGEFKNLGALMIDADEIAREVVCPGKDAYEAVVREFGKKVLKGDGSIDRGRLGKIVFSDQRRLEKLNAITHPPIMRRIVELMESLRDARPGEIIVLNAPLLIEVGLHKTVDTVVVVYANEENQLLRLRKRDNLGEEEAKARMNAQIPLSKKLGYADFVINNNGAREDTLEQARKVYSMLASMPGARTTK